MSEFTWNSGLPAGPWPSEASLTEAVVLIVHVVLFSNYRNGSLITGYSMPYGPRTKQRGWLGWLERKLLLFPASE